MLFSQLKKGSLKQKLVKRIVFISLGVIFCLLLINSIFVINQEKEKLHYELSLIEDASLENLSNSLWTLNRSLAQIQIEGLASSEYITHIDVYDDDKLFVTTTQNNPTYNNVIKKNYPLTFLVDNEMVKIGHVNVTADASGIYINAIKEGIILLLINTLFVLILIYLTLKFLSRNVFKHLESMSEFMGNVSWDDSDEKFDLNRTKKLPDETDELDHLVNAFNYQREQLVEKNKELALSQDKFFKIFQSSPDAILLTTYEEGRIIEVNQSFYRMFGFAQGDDIVGKTTTELGIWSITESRGEWIKHLQQKGAIYMREGKYRKNTGEERDCIASSQMINIDDKLGLVWSVRDISDRKRYETEILKSQRRLHNLAKSQEEIRENERTGISREIHDELGQAFTGLKIDLSWLQDHLDQREQANSKINTMIETIDISVDVVRRISSELRPALLDDLGLVAAIEWFSKDFSSRTGIEHSLKIECDDLTLDKQRDTAIFRIYQEALTNIARHSKATEFTAKLYLHDDKLELKIIDNGVGITDAELKSDKSIGIIGMEERAANIDAKINIFNREDVLGVIVHLISPLHVDIKER